MSAFYDAFFRVFEDIYAWPFRAKLFFWHVCGMVDRLTTELCYSMVQLVCTKVQEPLYSMVQLNKKTKKPPRYTAGLFGFEISGTR